jgi:hypothetical protein
MSQSRNNTFWRVWDIFVKKKQEIFIILGLLQLSPNHTSPLHSEYTQLIWNNNTIHTRLPDNPLSFTRSVLQWTI